MNTSNDYTIESVKKALKILKLFDTAESNDVAEFTLMDIVGRTGYNKSSVLRLLYTLNNEKFIKFEAESKKYSLDVTLMRLGTSAQNNLDIRRVAYPIIKELCDAVNLTVFLAVIVERQVMVVDKLFPNTITTIPHMSAQIGLALPLHSTGLGQLYLGSRNEEDQRNILNNTDLVPFASKTIVDIDKIIDKANGAYSEGISHCDGENEDFISSICCPVRDRNGEMVGGLSIGGITEVLQGEKKPFYEKYVVEAAKKISLLLGYRVSS